MAERIRDASGLRYSAHGFSRGKRARSSTVTFAPSRARCHAAELPAGPAPITSTSTSALIVRHAHESERLSRWNTPM